MAKIQYFSDLLEITSSGVDNNLVELEVDGHVGRLPDDSTRNIVMLGKMGGTIYLVFGNVVEYEYIKPEDSVSGKDFTRMKIEGTCVTVF